VTLTEVLRVARESYVSAFAEALSDHGACHVEPALRRADGSLVLDGHPPSPVRLDLIVKSTGARINVEAAVAHGLQAWTGSVRGLNVAISPFHWEQAHLSFDGAGVGAADRVVAWFTRWFDPDDSNRAGPDGLYGVVHYLSDIAGEDAKLRFTVDFGTVSATAVEELFQLLADSGATRGSVT
jgi:hypothetical protein